MVGWLVALTRLNCAPRQYLLDHSEPRRAGKARIAFLLAIAIHAGAIAWAGVLMTLRSNVPYEGLRNFDRLTLTMSCLTFFSYDFPLFFLSSFFMDDKD